MDFRHQISSPDALASHTCDALVLVVTGDAVDPALDAPLAAALSDALAHGDLTLKAGKSIYIHRPAGIRAARVAFVAAGGSTVKAFKAAVANGIKLVNSSGAKHVAIGLAGAGSLTDAHAEAVVTAARECTYLYRHTKPSAPAASKLDKVTLLCTKADVKAVQLGVARGHAIAAGVNLAREWANRPGNHCTPTHLADVAKKLGKEYALKVEVLDRKACEKLGMGSFLSVAQASTEPLRFIIARYDGAPKAQAPVVLVGKGITFDTGGISLKPGPEMDEMKFDMCGAASVLGVFRALADLKPAINVVGLIPSCENMPDGKAIKPGDVVTSMSGQTIEILNTDAEGRLVLCDALTYAERFLPRAVIDIATLTGACVIALGGVRSGLFASADDLAADLQAAGEAAQDLCWRMPLDDDYAEALKTNFADVANVGGRAGGAITAAKFLHRFTAKFPWAHLDIAGTAWKGGAAKGATGRPVPLLLNYLLAQAAKTGVAPKKTPGKRRTPA